MAEPSLNEILPSALALSREAGRGAEQLFRGRISERFPDHAILGEDFGPGQDARREAPVAARDGPVRHWIAAVRDAYRISTRRRPLRRRHRDTHAR